MARARVDPSLACARHYQRSQRSQGGIMRRRPAALVSLFVCLLTFLVARAFAAVQPTSTGPNSDPVYQQLRNAGLSGEAVSVSNLDLKREIGTFHLRSGTICFLTPCSRKSNRRSLHG